MKAQKRQDPKGSSRLDLSHYAIYSVIGRRHSLRISSVELGLMRAACQLWNGVQGALPSKADKTIRAAARAWAGKNKQT